MEPAGYCCWGTLRIEASEGAHGRSGLLTGMTTGRTSWWQVCAVSGAVDTLRADGSIVPAGTLGSIGTLGAGGAGILVGTLGGADVACGRASAKMMASFVRAACCLYLMRAKGADGAGWRRVLVSLIAERMELSAEDSLGILTWIRKKLAVSASRFPRVLVM